MTISRGQMNRQLYMGGGIMNVVPREPALLGGIKRAVKKVTKGVKDIASSDLGKAALLAAGAYYAPGIGIKAQFGPGISGLKAAGIAAKSKLGDFFVGSPLTEEVGRGSFSTSGLGKILNIGGGGKGIGNLGKLATLGLVSKFLTQSLGMTEEQAEEELARDPSGYLEQYYRNLNPPTADTTSEQYEQQVRDFVTANTSEYAVGGRVGYQDAGPVLPPDPTQPVNPFGPKPIGPVLPDRMMASNMENDKILEALFEKYLDMGLSPKDAAEKAREEFERMGKGRIEETRGLAALGGRMGFDEGTSRRGLMGSVDETMDIPMQDEDIVVIITMDENGMPILKQVPRSEVMPKGVLDSGRAMKAKGDTASMNAMQAAGVEGLPIRQNPKGVKELDLRETGGFIQPVGIKEKEDDIPAMLSNNEFVFTADAVRGAGDGNVNVGAQRMYDMMKKLEAGGRV